jgi:putative membrane protein
MDREVTRQGGARASRRHRLYDIGTDPDYRYSLANERTFLSWVRTALALMAGGVAVVQWAPDLGPHSGRVMPGLALIVIAGMLAGASHRRWLRRERAMRLDEALPHTRLPVFLGYSLAAVAVVLLATLILAAA